MRWFGLWISYIRAPYEFEKGIPIALDVFKKSHKIDASRVFIAGMGQGGLMAFHVAANSNGSYKGAVVWGSTVLPGAPVAARAKVAARAGLKVALLEPNGAVWSPMSSDAKDVAAELDALPKFLADCGLTAPIEKFDAKPDDQGLAVAKIVAALKSFLPAPEPPEEKKADDDEKKEKDDDGGGGGGS